METITLRTVLDKPDNIYKGGEIIAGQVKVSVAERIQSAELVLGLYCKGSSKAPNISKTIEKKQQEIHLFIGSWMPERYIYPFEIIAPESPLTYQGQIFDVGWYLKTIARSSKGKDIAIKSEITLLKEKRMPMGNEVKNSEEVVHSQSSGKSLTGCFSVTLAFTFIGIYFAWKTFSAEGDYAGLYGWGGTILITFGLIAFFLLTYTALINRRIKKAEVRLGSRQVNPGGKVPFILTFEANTPFEIEKISATLRGNEIVDFFRSSKNKKYLKQCLYENRQELPFSQKKISTKAPFQVKGESLIPKDAPCSIDLMESGKGMALSWEIEFAIEMKKWPDWIHFEDITVQP
jgi:hypothetical protein